MADVSLWTTSGTNSLKNTDFAFAKPTTYVPPASSEKNTEFPSSLHTTQEMFSLCTTLTRIFSFSLRLFKKSSKINKYPLEVARARRFPVGHSLTIEIGSRISFEEINVTKRNC